MSLPGSTCGALADAWRSPGSAFTLNVPMLLRLNMFHLLQAVSPNSIGLDIAGARLDGGGLPGHIFWDELFIFPFLNYRIPRSPGRCSCTLPAPRRGAPRPEARVSGRHVSWRRRWAGGNQELNLNPRSQRWVPDNPTCSATAERHRLERLAVLSSHARRRVSAVLRRRADARIARFWSSIATLMASAGATRFAA